MEVWNPRQDDQNEDEYYFDDEVEEENFDSDLVKWYSQMVD
jgi:hypothetical protein